MLDSECVTLVPSALSKWMDVWSVSLKVTSLIVAECADFTNARDPTEILPPSTNVTLLILNSTFVWTRMVVTSWAPVIVLLPPFIVTVILLVESAVPITSLPVCVQLALSV